MVDGDSQVRLVAGNPGQQRQQLQRGQQEGKAHAEHARLLVPAPDVWCCIDRSWPSGISRCAYMRPDQGRSGKPAALESLGLAGWGAHARDERIELDSIVSRLYLSIKLLMEFAQD